MAWYLLKVKENFVFVHKLGSITLMLPLTAEGISICK